MMIDNLNRTGFSAFSVSVPSPNELLQIFALAAPVFITMTSKVFVIFYYIFFLYTVHMWTNSQNIAESCLFSGGFLFRSYIFCYFYGDNNDSSSPGQFLPFQFSFS